MAPSRVALAVVAGFLLLSCATADESFAGRRSLRTGRELLQDPTCSANPARINPCFAADGGSNICCATPCGPVTSDGKPTCSGEPAGGGASKKCYGPRQLLYVWAGVTETSSSAKDFVAVVSIDRQNNYGQILSRAEIDFQGTEAHHMGQSPDGKWLVAGGVFAAVQGKPQIFFYNIEDDPYHPRYTGSLDPVGSGETDQIVFDSKGNAIITQMGSKTGGTPGRLLEINQPFPNDFNALPGNKITPKYAEYGEGAPQEDKLNPHGLDVNDDSTVAISGDFIQPDSLSAPKPEDIIFRDTLRIWRRDGQQKWVNTKTLTVPGAGGVQDVQFINGDSQQRALATLVGLSALALVNPTDDSVKVVYNFEGKTCNPHVSDISNDGKRYFVSCIGLGEVWMLDISDPENPIKLDVKSTGGPASLPHFVKLSPNNDRLFTSQYFVTAGLATAEGARTVLSFIVQPNGLAVDTDFGTLAFADIKDYSGVRTNSRPHGMTVNYLNCN